MATPARRPLAASNVEDDDQLDENLPLDTEGDEDETDPPPADVEEEDDAVIEARARRAGWIPEEEWDDERAAKEGKTKPRRWYTPKEWLERMQGNNKTLRERNNFLDGEVKRIGGEARAAAARIEDLSALVDDLLKTQKSLGDRAYEKARRELQAKMDAAVEDTNPEGYKEAKAGLAQLDEERAEAEKEAPKPREKPPANNGGTVDPYVATWVKENPWYDSDAIARGAAVAEHGRLMKAEPDLTLRENLAKVRAAVADRFPEHFENPRRREAPRVMTPSGDQGRTGKKVTFSDLTAEQKATYERQQRHFKSKGSDYTKEQFLEDQLLG